MSLKVGRSGEDREGTGRIDRIGRNGRIERNVIPSSPEPQRSEDGTFKSGGHFGENTGRWSIDPETGELFIDSDAGENDDSYWFVSFKDDVMIWTGARGFGREFVLKHRCSQ